MFNRETGDVNPAVVAYWRDHYDLAHIVTADWAKRGPYLRGKIHVFVGTADTFYLDGAAHQFDAVLSGLHANAHFTFIPDRTHMDLYTVGDDRAGLFDVIGARDVGGSSTGEGLEGREVAFQFILRRRAWKVLLYPEGFPFAGDHGVTGAGEDYFYYGGAGVLNDWNPCRVEISRR